MFPLSLLFIPVDNNAEASTRDETMSWILTEGNRERGNHIKPEDKDDYNGDDITVTTVPEASNMVHSLQCLVTTKEDFPEQVLVGTEILHECNKKLLLKWNIQKKLMIFSATKLEFCLFNMNMTIIKFLISFSAPANIISSSLQHN